MADEEYNKKLESLQRYIPFLENMITELTIKGNREAQLIKIKSLHGMITNTEKKLKIETLHKCEEVLKNIHQKVSPNMRLGKITPKDHCLHTLPGIESPRSTPRSPTPPKNVITSKPVNIPTEKIPSPTLGRSLYDFSSKSHRPKIEVYSNVVIRKPTKTRTSEIVGTIPDMSKPPISLDDLKHLEDDVQQKITDDSLLNKSVDELQEVKKQIQLQLRVEEISLTMCPEKDVEKGITSKSKKHLSPKGSKNSPIKEMQSPSHDKKTSKSRKESKEASNNSPTKNVVKETDIFGNLLSSMDNKLLEGNKKLKKGDRRSSKEDSGNTSNISLDRNDAKEFERTKQYKKHSSRKDRHSSSDKNMDKRSKHGRGKEKSKEIRETESKLLSKSKDSFVTKDNKQLETEKNEINKTTADLKEGSRSQTLTQAQESFQKKLNEDMSSKSNILTNKSTELTNTDTPKSATIYKRLADKYNPRPRQPSSDIDVERSLSDSIEQSMKATSVSGQSGVLDVAKPVEENLKADTNASSIDVIIQTLFKNTAVLNQLKSNAVQNVPYQDLRQVSSQQKLDYKPPRFMSPPQEQSIASSDLLTGTQLLPNSVSSVPRVSNFLQGNLTISHPGLGQLPSPSILPHNLPRTRVDFVSPSESSEITRTPRIDFESPCIEQVTFPNSDRFNLNQNFVPPIQEHRHDFSQDLYASPNLYKNIHESGTSFNRFDLNQSTSRSFYNSRPTNYYNTNEQNYNQERMWSRDRRPDGPRNYKEYKEMRERQEREAKAVQEKQMMKDPRLTSRENIRDPRLIAKQASKSSGESTEDKTGELKSKNVEKLESNKLDIMYSKTNQISSRHAETSKEKDAFVSPLNSLYSLNEKGKTGKGYGIQSFKIPKKPKKESDHVGAKVKKDTKSVPASQKVMVVESSDSEEDNALIKDEVLILNDLNKDTNSKKNVRNSTDRNKRDTSKTKASRENKKSSYFEKTITERTTIETDTSEEVKEASNKLIPKNTTEQNLLQLPQIDTSRFKVLLNSNSGNPSNSWLSPALECNTSEDNFVSEYVKEFDMLPKDHDLELIEDESTLVHSKQNLDKKNIIQEEERVTLKHNLEEQLPKQVEKQSDVEHVASKDSLETSRELPKENEPNEQNILAHFFQNLLKSTNKRDKKSALFSLIETFSDSFNDREIQKIRQIIHIDNKSVDDGSDNESVGSQADVELKKTEIIQDQQAVVESTTGEHDLIIDDKESDAQKKSDQNISLVTETQVNEISKSTDKTEQDTAELPHSDEATSTVLTISTTVNDSDSLEPVMESVGERIKSRKRLTSKPKKKCKTELDMLHEDIKDMFIRDGVLTANGKRMCRMLKDDPSALSTSEGSSTSLMEQPKFVPKRRGRQLKIKVPPEYTYKETLKDMRVVISKMPDEALTSPLKRLRRRTTKVSYTDTDEESSEADISEPSKSDVDEESADSEEDNDFPTNEESRKPKIKRRKTPKWASGIIPKIKKKKTSQQSTTETVSEQFSSAVTNNPLKSGLLQPDKNYYYDYVTKEKLQCLLCKFSGHSMTLHYIKEHPQSEVLCSRFSPDAAFEAIKNYEENRDTLESLSSAKILCKYKYSCRLCGFTTEISPLFFYEHVTTHTGEYRHQCLLCEYAAANNKTMSAHLSNTHPDQERKTFKSTYSLAVVFAYLCGDCNFVQLKKRSVQDHINVFHSEDTAIYKISMSKVLDSSLEVLAAAELSKTNALQSTLKAADDSEQEDDLMGYEDIEHPEPKVKSNLNVISPKKTITEEIPIVRKKPGPKSKTLPQAELHEAKELSNEIVTPVKKKPGPKSKTLIPVVPEKCLNHEEVREQNQVEQSKSLQAKNSGDSTENAHVRKRRGSIDKLISEDSGDDLDTIITLSSRSSRAAKEKATAKLKSMMDNEAMPLKKKSENNASKKDNVSGGGNDKEVPAVPIESTQNKNSISAKATGVEEMLPPVVTKSINSNDSHLGIFTCMSDFTQEDAKKIEEDRLRKMDELNKSIGSRTPKLDFVNKLSSRLNSEHLSDLEQTPVKIKTEPKDNDINPDPPIISHTILKRKIKNEALESSAKSINKPSVVSGKKPVFDEQSIIQQSNIDFGQNKSNSLFSNTIKKLQGKVNEAASLTNAEIPVNELSAIEKRSSSSPDRSISLGGLISATKINQEFIYHCHIKNCSFETKDKVTFKLHCKFGHEQIDKNIVRCDKCDINITDTEDTTLLENLFDHLCYAHSDFVTSRVIRTRRLSGDQLSVIKTEAAFLESEHFGENIDHRKAKDVFNDTSSTVALQTGTSAEMELISSPSETFEDNPFPFQIANVMSLAETNENEDDSWSSVKKSNVNASKVSPLPSLKVVPALSLITPVPKQPAVTTTCREAKLTTAELARPRKAPNVMQKFIENPGDLYKCPHFYCVFSTSVRMLLMCHLKAHITNNKVSAMVPCVYCDMKTPWKHVPLHIDIRHANSKYACYYCLYRAALKEYVLLHEEQHHPGKDYIFYSLSIQKSPKKLMIVDPRPDLKTICEPFRCVCPKEDGGNTVVHEYLFELEFIRHLNSAHLNQSITCGYQSCNYVLPAVSMLAHWSLHHGVCTYQCCYCKTSSKVITGMYNHFAQTHPNLTPDILVRKNESLPHNQELGYSDAAFQMVGHVRKIPPNFLLKLGNCTNIPIKEIHVGPSSEGNDSVRKTDAGILPGSSLLLTTVTENTGQPNSQNRAHQLLIPNQNLQLIVTSTSSEKVYLLPTSAVSPTNVKSTTSTAPISRIQPQTTAASDSRPVRIGDITLYPDDSAAIEPVIGSDQRTAAPAATTVTSATHSTIAMLSQSILSNSINLDKPLFTTAPIVSAVPVTDGRSTNKVFEKTLDCEDLILDQDAVSEDDILQTAIQSILDQGDDSNTEAAFSAFEHNVHISDIPELATSASDLSLGPPPLVMLSDGPSTNSKSHNRQQLVAPVEHIVVAEPDENSLIAEFHDNTKLLTNASSLSEDPLNISSAINSNLSPGHGSLVIDENTCDKDPLDIVADQTALGESDLSNSDMQRPSIVLNSDEESDTCGVDKKKFGLEGYQLFRCAICSLSFANVKFFKTHVSVSPRCRNLGPKPFQCAHCDKQLKSIHRLVEHTMTHGIQRFSCSLCNEKFPITAAAKFHMKNRHSLQQTTFVPLKPYKIDMELDEFVIKPAQSNLLTPKEKDQSADYPKSTVDDSTYTPDQIDSIPIRQIFNNNVRCGLCNYQTKVRVNIIRHLQMHLDEKTVPDTAPVNPVPCLEKNEKMFDKMINLAASSISNSGRMGGSGKDKEKEEKYPEFIASHRRFVCCAQGCSYLCPEEGNLKHHIIALHSDESNFNCAHCKIRIEPAEVEHILKHFKLHGLHLYKCNYCNFNHHLKHKIERHIGDNHLDAAVKVITIRSMDAEPQDDVTQEEKLQQSGLVISKFKPWSCCMCKARCHSKEDIQSHVTKKHNIDAQYKCTLCSFKNDNVESCRKHFKEEHPANDFDVIFVYQKLEDDTVKNDFNTPFDTTPLWQRDKRRVRHIRGILFDETSPQKSPKKAKIHSFGSPSALLSDSNEVKEDLKTSNVLKDSPVVLPSGSSKKQHMSSQHIFDCIEAVANGTAITLNDKRKSMSTESHSRKQQVSDNMPSCSRIDDPLDIEIDVCDIDPADSNNDIIEVPQEQSVIVIDSGESDSEETLLRSPENMNSFIKSEDDDIPKSKDKDSKTKPMAKNRGTKRRSTDTLQGTVKVTRIETEDDLDYQMVKKCSKENLRELYGSFGSPNHKQFVCPKCNRFKSKRVGDFIYHLYKEFETFRFECVTCLDRSISAKYMQGHLSLPSGDIEHIATTLPSNVLLDTWIHMVLREQSLEILRNSEKMNKRPIIGSPNIICYFCNEKFMSMVECCEHMLYHWVVMPYECQHCSSEFYTVYDLKYHHKIEHPDLKLYSDAKGPTIAKTLHCLEKNVKFTEEIKSQKKNYPTETGLITLPSKRRKLLKSPSKPLSSDVINIEDDDDLVIVSKTDSVTLHEDEVYACDACEYITETETKAVQHVREKHGFRSNRFHKLSKLKSDIGYEEKFACNICDEIFTELQLRLHFIENHCDNQPSSTRFLPYRYICGMCPSKFMTIGKMKSHFCKTHPLEKYKVTCIEEPSKKSKQIKKPRFKLMNCTICPFSVVSVNTVSMRVHLRAHLKPTRCDHCLLRFKSLNEAMAHNSHSHPGIGLSCTTLEPVLKELNDVLKNISQSAKTVAKEDKDESISPKVSQNFVARKSTSKPFSRQPDQLTSSSIASPEKKTGLTTFELDGLEYTMSVEQVMKMFDMDPYVDMTHYSGNDIA